MLFSSADVSKFINDNYEAAWESVRPVPMLTIDFGNGKSITRTLHGNIATYLCNSDGNVLDVVPGIYTPDVYKQRLEQFQLLVRYIRTPLPVPAVQPANPNLAAARVAPERALREYHKGQAEALKAQTAPGVLFFGPMDRGKGVIENPVKLVAGAEANKVVPGVPANAKREAKLADSAIWKALAEDTKLNETVRREQIHRKLAEVGLVKPDQIVKWLYKDVLHADLDDPYLGLGEALFKNYPFAAEDAGKSTASAKP